MTLPPFPARARLLRVGLAAACALTLSAAIACGGDDGGADPTAEIEPTAVPLPTEFPSPVVTDNAFRDDTKGYSGIIPEGWRFRPNFALDAATAIYPTDAFFSPDDVNGIQASITMVCNRPAAGATLETVRADFNQFLSNFAVSDIQTEDITVAGTPAAAFTYAQELRGQSSGEETPVVTAVQKRDVTFLNGECRWLISLLTPPDTLDEHLPTFQAFLDALAFQSATPAT